jgi:protein SCO1/2
MLSRYVHTLGLLAFCACNHSSGQLLYVADEGSGDIAVVDTATGTTTAKIPVGDAPHDLHLASGGDSLVVAVNNGLAIVDRATQTLSRTVAMTAPRAFAIDGAVAYVASPGILAIVDTTSGSVARRADICADPTGVALGATSIFVACHDGHDVLVIDSESLGTTGHVTLANEPTGLAMAAGRVYALGSVITIIDASAATVIRSIATPASAVTTLADGVLLATNPRRGSATVVAADGTTSEITKVGARPSGITADGDQVFVANGPSNDITIVDSRGRRVVGRIAVGNHPSSLVVAPPMHGVTPLPHFGRVPTFALTDEGGHPIATKDLGGAPWVANFIFTRCPTACPLYTERMAALHHSLPGLRIVSFSVDPDFDTPERLRDFAGRHNALAPVWSFVTGPFAEIRAAVTDGFKVAMGRDEGHAGEGNIFHGEQAVLVDAGGAMRGYYALSDNDAAKKIAADLARLGVVAVAAH